MNIKSLDYKLKELSESEKRYRDGHIFTGWSNMPKKELNGKLYSVIGNEHEISTTSEPFRHSGNNRYFMDLGNTITIKKTSRFNPVPEHIHDYIEMNFVYSGTCSQSVDGKDVLLQKGQVLLIDTECPHSIGYLGDDDILLSIIIPKAYLRESFLSQISQDNFLTRFFIQALNTQTDHDHYILFHSEENERISLFFAELCCEYFDPSINANDITLHLFYLILAELINVYESDLVTTAKSPQSSLAFSILHYMQHNFQTCTQSDVAELFHISPNYVTTLLKKEIGMSYIQLVQTYRLDYSAQLLNSTSLPVTEIAAKAGYENVTFFYRKFREKYGCSPKDYRRPSN